MLPLLRVVCGKQDASKLEGFTFVANQGDATVIETHKDVDAAFDQVESADFPLAGELFVQGAPYRLATKIAFATDGKTFADVTMPQTEHGSCADDYDGEGFLSQLSHVVAILNPGAVIERQFSGLLK